MYQNITCLPTYYIIILIIIFIAFLGLYIFEKNNKCKKNDKDDKVQHINYYYNDIPQQLYLDKRDKDVLYDDFAPPERREPAYQYPSKYMRNRLNIPTRGIPDSYQLVGVLLRDNTESAYKLFGRQKYPGSSQYEYYVQSVLYDNDVKIPIKIKGDKEVEEHQIVHIPGTDSTKGQFRVKLYDLNAPKYNI
jgi:hypothetical protein